MKAALLLFVLSCAVGVFNYEIAPANGNLPCSSDTVDGILIQLLKLIKDALGKKPIEIIKGPFLIPIESDGIKGAVILSSVQIDGLKKLDIDEDTITLLLNESDLKLTIDLDLAKIELSGKFDISLSILGFEYKETGSLKITATSLPLKTDVEFQFDIVSSKFEVSEAKMEIQVPVFAIDMQAENDKCLCNFLGTQALKILNAGLEPHLEGINELLSKILFGILKELINSLFDPKEKLSFKMLQNEKLLNDTITTFGSKFLTGVINAYEAKLI